MSLTSTTKARASTQAGATIETKIGKIVRVYQDATGNVTHGDVIVQGETTALISLPNSSGGKFAKGDNVTVNFPRGQPLAGQVTTFSGAESSATAQSVLTSQGGGNSKTTVPPSVANIPILLAGDDDSVNSAYVATPGANISFAYQDPGTVAGSGNGLETISATVTLATTTLPNPATTLLPGGTLLDLLDTGRNTVGMYRLDTSGASAVWRRRDTGGGGGGGSAPVRASAVITTTSLANNAADTGQTAAITKSGHLLRASSNVPCYFCLYASAADMAADAGRAITTDPPSGAGIMLECKLIAGALSLDLGPSPFYYDNDTTITGNLPIRIINQSGGTSVVNVTLVYLPSGEV